MELELGITAAVTGYLVGSISFARVINRIVAPEEAITGMSIDVSGREEKMEVSAVSGTAVSMKLGAKYGGLTAILDILKVALPALAFRLLYPGTPYFLILAGAGLLGHNWPLYHRFKGGRGMSAIYGGFLVTDWIGSLVTAVVGMVFGLAVLKDVVVSYLAGLWLMIPWLWFRTHDLAYVAYAVFVNVIFIVAMIPEIKKVIELRRMGADQSVSAGMDATPMGKMMKKMANRFGLMKE